MHRNTPVPVNLSGLWWQHPHTQPFDTLLCPSHKAEFPPIPFPEFSVLQACPPPPHSAFPKLHRRPHFSQFFCLYFQNHFLNAIWLRRRIPRRRYLYASYVKILHSYSLTQFLCFESSSVNQFCGITFPLFYCRTKVFRQTIQDVHHGIGKCSVWHHLP